MLMDLVSLSGDFARATMGVASAYAGLNGSVITGSPYVEDVITTSV